MHVRPYRIDVPESTLDDLRRRLAATRFPAPLPGGGWAHGADVAYVRELCEHWRARYDWRSHEASLNRIPQYLCEIDGVDLHFWHARGKGPAPVPLLLVHGWPGSIYEFHHLIGPLTDPAAHGGDPADAFDVVVPSLPGYGFSGKPREPGWDVRRIAAAFDRLMVEALGYPRYGAQGGDWGAFVSARLGAAHAEHLLGVHVNLVLAAPPAGELTEEAQRALATVGAFRAAEGGYSHVQGTKPMSLAIAQSDSPAGLVAWIVEKFRTWSDCGGDVERVFSKDQLLTNAMFYWAPDSIASAANLYYETVRDEVIPSYLFDRIAAPTAVADFPREIYRAPRAWVESRANLVRWTEMPRGGHFAALEAPELLLEDVRAFFRSLRARRAA
ncbi:epoxide hydrolase [Sorangium sp. So ce269]